MKIFAARDEDAHQGWVWLKAPAMPARCVIKITNPASQKSIYCEALQIDSNFLADYNQSPRISIEDPQDTLVISAWYRANLGGMSTRNVLSLEIRSCNTWFGKFRACIDHPQVVVRLAAWLGGIGFILGVIGLVLGIVSLR